MHETASPPDARCYKTLPASIQERTAYTAAVSATPLSPLASAAGRWCGAAAGVPVPPPPLRPTAGSASRLCSIHWLGVSVKLFRPACFLNPSNSTGLKEFRCHNTYLLLRLRPAGAGGDAAGVPVPPPPLRLTAGAASRLRYPGAAALARINRRGRAAARHVLQGRPRSARTAARRPDSPSSRCRTRQTGGRPNELYFYRIPARPRRSIQSLLARRANGVPIDSTAPIAVTVACPSLSQ
jgi:hypothetical protein